jgi:hypothetical protein
MFIIVDNFVFTYGNSSLQPAVAIVISTLLRHSRLPLQPRHCVPKTLLNQPLFSVKMLGLPAWPTPVSSPFHLVQYLVAPLYNADILPHSIHPTPLISLHSIQCAWLALNPNHDDQWSSSSTKRKGRRLLVEFDSIMMKIGLFDPPCGSRTSLPAPAPVLHRP